MEKRLNLEQIDHAMTAGGLNQAGLAKALQVSRESVRKWLSDESFPRPDKLLKLARKLDLSFQQIVIHHDPAEPVVAFRKTRGSKTRDHHIENAQTMGRMLRHLVPFLPFDVLAMPPVLKQPHLDYQFLRKAAALIRHEIHVQPLDTLNFEHLIRHFGRLQAVLIPVRWGSKQVHENATHIYLPDSQTTWIYLNLDVNIHDFKFWMAHELGHCLAPELRGDEAEDFADAFAGMLLFPHELALAGLKQLKSCSDRRAQLERLLSIAEEHLISPFTVYKQVNACAEFEGEQPLSLEPDIFKWTTRLNQGYVNVSETIFDGELPPEPERYIDTVASVFGTPFFDVLGQFLECSGSGAGFVQTVLDIPLLDARGLHDALS